MICRATGAKFHILGLIVVSAAIAVMAYSFETHFVELDTARMILTGDNNYAIYHSGLPSSWRCVSVNGDEVTSATPDGVLVRPLSQLSEVERSGLNEIRNTLGSLITAGPFGMRPQTGLFRLTSFDRFGSSSSMGNRGGSGSSSSMSSSFMSSSSSSSSSTTGNFGSTSISRMGPNSSIVSRTDFPFNWQRLFINDEFVTAVHRDGRVLMLPQDLMGTEERAKVVEIRAQVDGMQQAQQQQFSNTMQHSMDMVSNVFNNIMSNFPKPPDYQNSVGNMFGNNFPFGPNNSPFSAESGWPFAGSGGGAAAMAIAGRRR